MKKLYVITRRDLSAGAQCAQACHAALVFSIAYPSKTEWWHTSSNNIVILTVENEAELTALLDKLRGHESRLAVVKFHEPDLKDQLTAIAVGDPPQELTSSLPLALRPNIEHDGDYYTMNGGKAALAG